jgi:hypothetical protein
MASKARLENMDLVFNNKASNASRPQVQLYVEVDEYEENVHSERWRIPMSLRVIEPGAALKIKLK